MHEARRFIISGHVQGVFFRASTRRVAESLGITGYAINLPDGDVEVLACGDGASLDELREWLKDGPPQARVDEVIESHVERQAPADFRTG